MMSTRRTVIFGSLAVTLLAVYFAPAGEGGAVVQPVRREGASTTRIAAAMPARGEKAATEVNALKSRSGTAEREFDLFSSQSWAPPPSKVVAAPRRAEPEPPPMAPPAPIKLLGRYEEGGADNAKVAMFALYNEQNVVLRAGETLGGDWRIDSIEANQVVLTYLPLGQQQTLPWAAP